MLSTLRWISQWRKESIALLRATLQKRRAEFTAWVWKIENWVVGKGTLLCAAWGHTGQWNIGVMRFRYSQRVWQMVQNLQLHMTTYVSIHFQQKNFIDYTFFYITHVGRVLNPERATVFQNRLLKCLVIAMIKYWAFIQKIFFIEPPTYHLYPLQALNSPCKDEESRKAARKFLRLKLISNQASDKKLCA